MKVLSNRKFEERLAEARAEAARQSADEVKGYYEARDDEFNKYLEIVAQQTKGMIEIQPLDQVGRKELKRLYLSCGPLYGVINKIASAVAYCARYLELIDRSTGKEVTNHYINNLLARPNDRFTRAKYFYGAATNRLLYGDGWNYLPMGVGKNRDPKEMYLIPSDVVGVKHGSWAQLFEGLVINGKKIDAKAVFENFSYNLDDTSFFGVSKASIAANYLTVIDRAIGREATALKNGGAANLISPAAMDVPALPTDIADTEDRLNKSSNANKSLMVKIPVAVHSLGSKPADLSILESHKDAVTALCFVYEIPVDLYYGQAKYENAKEAKKALYESAAIPFLEEWGEDFLSYLKLTDKYELRVNVDKIDVLQADPYAVGKNLAEIGAFSTNEIREACGWERIKDSWADEIRLPLGVQLGGDPTDFSEE